MVPSLDQEMRMWCGLLTPLTTLADRKSGCDPLKSQRSRRCFQYGGVRIFLLRIENMWGMDNTSSPCRALLM